MESRFTGSCLDLQDWQRAIKRRITMKGSDIERYELVILLKERKGAAEACYLNY